MIVFIAIGGKAREEEFLVIRMWNVFEVIISGVCDKPAQLNLLVGVQLCDATEVEKCPAVGYINSFLRQ
jgi:hypothetical protein